MAKDIYVKPDPEMPEWAQGFSWYDTSFLGNEWEPGGLAQPGDMVTVTIPVHRKWWQLWKPRIIGFRKQRYVVAEGRTSDG